MAEWFIDKMRKYGMSLIFNWGEGTNNCTSLPEFSELPRGDSKPIFMTLIVKFIVSKIMVLSIGKEYFSFFVISRATEMYNSLF